MRDEDQPKYLNSPETPIYTKTSVLYNLHRAKEGIRKEDRAILVEGYMDAIGVSAAGFGAVVASCGTSLTEQQVRMLKRHSGNIVVNFDPDAPGAAAAERSLSLLLQEGMFVRIMSLDGGLDPDEYCKERGAAAYGERVSDAKGYFYWLADRARAKHDVRTTEGVVAVLKALAPVVERIPDRMERMAVANDLAAYVGVSPGVVLDSFRRTVSDRREARIEAPKQQLRADEKGLLNVLFSDLKEREALLPELKSIEILDRMTTGRIYRAIIAASSGGAEVPFDSIGARLEDGDRNLLAELALSEDVERQEMSVEYGRECLASLRRSGQDARREDMKARIKHAERGGNLAEALRLAQEMSEWERSSESRN